jgi:hypothetical protein
MPSCPTHPAASAVAICSRCGRFVCGDCLELTGETPLCLECHERASGAVASRRATASMVLALMGLCCGFAPGVVGLVLARRELQAIERGEAPLAGLSRARAGFILGGLDAVLLLFAILAALFVRHH